MNYKEKYNIIFKISKMHKVNIVNKIQYIKVTKNKNALRFTAMGIQSQ